MNKESFIFATVLVESIIFMVAMISGWIFVKSPSELFHPSFLHSIYALLATIPFVLVSIFIGNLPFKELQDIKIYLRDNIGSVFAKMNVFELMILALCVGICEEALFRGFLQPYIEQASGRYWIGLLVSNILFAILHPVSRVYVLITFIYGLYLGFLLDLTNSRELSIPILVHGLYDWVMFFVVRREFFQYEEEFLGDISKEES